MFESCANCEHCRIEGDDRYIQCKLDKARVTDCQKCDQYIARADGLEATQVWDWR